VREVRRAGTERQNETKTKSEPKRASTITTLPKFVLPTAKTSNSGLHLNPNVNGSHVLYRFFGCGESTLCGGRGRQGTKDDENEKPGLCGCVLRSRWTVPLWRWWWGGYMNPYSQLNL